MIRKILLIALLVFSLPSLRAGSDGGDKEKEKDFRGLNVENVHVLMELEHIQITFLVRDEKGNFIRDLSVDDFVVFENGKPQTIAALKEQEVPISAVIMVDTSWSIGTFLENALNTALDFFRGLEKERSAFVLFSEGPRVLLGWEGKRESLFDQVKDLKTDGKTALYDSVVWVAEEMFRNQSGKKLIILITDGIDTVSASNFEEMMAATRRAGITLYPIIYTNQYIQNYRKRLTFTQQPSPRISRDFHRFVILQNQFVNQSLRYGGRTIFSNNFADLERIYGDIIREMKSHYVMLYQSQSDSDQDPREVKVHTKKVPGKIFIEISH